MITVTMRVTASSHGAEHFGRDAFTGQIGKTIPVGMGTGKLVAAQIVDNGRAAELTLECDDSTARRLSVVGPGEYSLGFTPREGVTMTPILAAEADTEPTE